MKPCSRYHAWEVQPLHLFWVTTEKYEHSENKKRYLIVQLLTFILSRAVLSATFFLLDNQRLHWSEATRVAFFDCLRSLEHVYWKWIISFLCKMSQSTIFTFTINSSIIDLVLKAFLFLDLGNSVGVRTLPGSLSEIFRCTREIDGPEVGSLEIGSAAGETY